jgi:arsenate reductase (thioredoxin)
VKESIPYGKGGGEDVNRILILCTGNSCRSQMAEYVLRLIDPGLEVHSAGTDPAPRVHPRAVAVMREIGVDMTGALPKRVDRFLGEPFDFVITVCDNAREQCPVFTGNVRTRVHLGFDDPAAASGTEEEVVAVFRRVRDEIRKTFQEYYTTTIRIPMEKVRP